MEHGQEAEEGQGSDCRTVGHIGVRPRDALRYRTCTRLLGKAKEMFGRGCGCGHGYRRGGAVTVSTQLSDDIVRIFVRLYVVCVIVHVLASRARGLRGLRDCRLYRCAAQQTLARWGYRHNHAVTGVIKHRRRRLLFLA